MSNTTRPRLLTGDRPTGSLHLGHLVGSLETRVALQESHECFIIVADLHTLTTRPKKDQIGELPSTVTDVVLDLLSVGIDPKKSTIYLQSGVPAVYDLAILLQMLTPVARLKELPTVASMADAAGLSEKAVTMGLLGYPVLQAADILMACAEVVPVGRDNEEHINVARELAGGFNRTYGEVFPIPEARISSVPELPGVAMGPGGTANKMSKSFGNAIFLKDSPKEVSRKLATLSEGSGADPGVLVEFVQAFVRDGARAAALSEGVRAGRTTAAEVVAALKEAIEDRLIPIRERREKFEREDGLVAEIIVDGTIRAREIAYGTLQRAREAMGLEALWTGLVDATQRRAEARKKPY
jgi:tryptophanyl-tRNA synthetase